jgi:hypothetical protein
MSLAHFRRLLTTLAQFDECDLVPGGDWVALGAGTGREW